MAGTMPSNRQQAVAEFKRIMKWIAVIAVLMVAGALTYLYLFSTLDTTTVIATTFGVWSLFSAPKPCPLIPSGPLGRQR